ncbi:MAG: amino acid permease, partial [Candidatus Solibacter sp.]|nr:amino acid permease [Candidatus Solibacter sp.]
AEAICPPELTPDQIYLNVQPLAGAVANTAVYEALVNEGDPVMGLNLLHGGHLSHGSPVNHSGKHHRMVFYEVDEKTELLDYDRIYDMAVREKPKMIIAGYTSVILVMLLGQSRVFFSMSKDGLLPPIFSDIHPKWQTPYRCNMIFMVFVSLFAGFLPISKLGHMTSIGTLLAFVIVCIGIIWMRKTNPTAPRPYRTPLVPLVPILGVLVCFAMMASLGIDTWIRLVVWLAIGLLIYFNYGVRNSHLRKAPQDKR